LTTGERILCGIKLLGFGGHAFELGALFGEQLFGGVELVLQAVLLLGQFLDLAAGAARDFAL